MTRRNTRNAQRRRTSNGKGTHPLATWGMGADEDEARAVLGNMQAEAAEIALWQARDPDAGRPEDRRGFLRYVAAQQQVGIPKIIEAAERGDTWGAVRHALWVGIMEGHLQAHPDEYHQRRKLRLQEPDAVRGRKVQGGALRGGVSRRGTVKGPDDAALRADYERHRMAHQNLTFTALCDRVAHRWGLSARTVRRRMRAILDPPKN